MSLPNSPNLLLFHAPYCLSMWMILSLQANLFLNFNTLSPLFMIHSKSSNLRQLYYFLVLEVAHFEQGISLCHRKYCLDFLADSGLTTSKPVSTSSDPSIKMHNDSSSPYKDISSYIRLIGRLLYLNTTRPGITFVTHQLTQFLTKPTHTHYNAAMRILRYLKSCPGKALFFPRDSTLHILAFSDADWAGGLDFRRPISGKYIFFGKIHHFLAHKETNCI